MIRDEVELLARHSECRVIVRIHRISIVASRLFAKKLDAVGERLELAREIV